MTEISKWAEWAEISTIVAAIAGLWALSFAWVTYAASVYQQNQDEFDALKSIVRGLRVELALMKDWTATGGQGYPKAMASPPEWANHGRLIWKFDIGAVSNLTRSPYLYRLDAIIEPFAKLNLSVSRLFQLYDEYRSFVNSDPTVFLQSRGSVPHTEAIRNFNRTMHVNLIGGADSDDPNCLYRAYNTATSTLDRFEADLSRRKLPAWFWIGHILGVACFVSGSFLLYVLVQ